MKDKIDDILDWILIITLLIASLFVLYEVVKSK